MQRSDGRRESEDTLAGNVVKHRVRSLTTSFAIHTKETRIYNKEVKADVKRIINQKLCDY